MTLVLKHFKQIIREVERDVKKKFRIRVKPVGAASMKWRGVYYPDANTIMLDLWKKDGSLLDIKEILKTLAHEMGHAATRYDSPVHCPKWKKSYLKIWKYVRAKYL